MKDIKTRRIIVFIGLTVISLIFTGQIYAKVDLKSAVAVWFFDEGNGEVSKDFTGNGNDGKLMSGATWDKGIHGGALSLDGQSAYVLINNAVDLVNPDFTVMVLLNPGKTQKQYADVFSNHGDDGKQRGYQMEQEAGNANQFRTNFGIGAGWTGLEGLTQLEAEKWQYFATVRQGTKMTHYVDGKETASCTVAKEPVFKSNWNFRIGDWAASSGRQFNGLIDEIAIFNEALSVDDVKNIAARGLAEATGVSLPGKLANTWGAIKIQ